MRTALAVRLVPIALAAALAACSTESGATDAGHRDAGVSADASAQPGLDASVPPDSGACIDRFDAGSPDASSGAICTFNFDCPSDERCECDNGDCLCKPGARGTGKVGVDSCTTGNDCESSLCAEGQGGVFYCSGPCLDSCECGPQLPNCEYVSFIGGMCVRQAP